MSRFAVTYRIRATDAAEARARAEGIAYEQTVEVPPDVVPPGFVRDEIVGRIEEIGPDSDGFRATISYSPESAGDDFHQFLNVVFGNSSLQKGIRVIAIDPGPEIRRRHPGARFGVEGIRRMARRPEGGLICPVLKPQGIGAEEIARIACLCALGGADIIKEDHGLSDLRTAPFRARVEAVVAALDRAELETGRRPAYFATLPGPFERIEANLAFAKAARVDGLVVMPGLFGWGLVSRIARDEALNLAVMMHPSLTGPFVVSEGSGMDCAVIYGTLQRLAGSDLSIFPNVGGRFGFTEGDCRAIAKACLDPNGPGRPILPNPGGGMSVDRAQEMQAMYGQDVAYLLGGSLLRHGEGLGAEIARMRRALDG
ncbi:RuBisCO large subunit C-terminal-like domain-containing protein [Rubellimicrobium roseum]|uniref:Ribulose 1,5-bisphosphate carboxylase n=1 Tax=Rubellimicrobium roseum TaxID=687525 RepID=A0A5C4NAC2_9RHOB|nr:RuBisCO large subunit C-terminal-like domain-containing protein [Rubellimicrobium roseum]TNC68502.1 ribulose 1,5-bisphosphate carboxylase [Rubellimicrobium roseum]